MQTSGMAIAVHLPKGVAKMTHSEIIQMAHSDAVLAVTSALLIYRKRNGKQQQRKSGSDAGNTVVLQGGHEGRNRRDDGDVRAVRPAI